MCPVSMMFSNRANQATHLDWSMKWLPGWQSISSASWLNSSLASCYDKPLKFKKPQKFNHARQVFTDLGDPYKQRELKIKIGSCFKLQCPKDPDVKQAADLLMELSSSASSSSSGPPIWSDEMYPWPQPEVVRLKMRGMPEICVS